MVNQYTQEQLKILSFIQENKIERLYHFTAIDNLKSINKIGALLSFKECKTRGIVPIGGGNELSKQIDNRRGLDDYVRLSFCSDHPMRWHLKSNGIPTILIAYDPKVLLLPGVLVSDINAIDSRAVIAEAYTGLQKVKIDAIHRMYVSNTDPDFKYHQAEILIPHSLDNDYAIGIIKEAPGKWQ